MAHFQIEGDDQIEGDHNNNIKPEPIGSTICDDDTKDFEETPINNDKPITIAVIGATGAGKSTLCNLICKQSTFTTQRGFNSCTVSAESCTFTHPIGSNRVKFKIIDSPGFVHEKELFAGVSILSEFLEKKTILSEFFEKKPISNLEDDIKLNWNDMNQGGISMYLLAVPYKILNRKHLDSIRLVSDYFSLQNINRVCLVLTQTGELTTEQAKAAILCEDELSTLLKKINGRCVAVESVDGTCDQIKTARDTILKKAFYAHEHLGGANNRCAMLEAVRNYVIEWKQHLLVNTASGVMKMLEIAGNRD